MEDRRWWRSAATDGTVCFTNSLYGSWYAQFYPDGVRGWMAKLHVRPERGAQLDHKFFVEFDGMRPHQVHPEAGKILTVTPEVKG